MEEATVRCGCGRTMALDARRGRGAFRCGCGTTIQINLQARPGTACVGSAPDGTACRLNIAVTDPLPLCQDHYTSTGLRQYHRWRTRGPEEIALDVGGFVDSAIRGRDIPEDDPRGLIQWRLDIQARRREAEAYTPPATPDWSELEAGGIVYFVRLDARVKIGKTLNLSKRLQAFSNPLIHVVATEPGYTTRERQLHKRFATLREAGEWFRLEPPLTDYIRGLPGYRRNLEH